MSGSRVFATHEDVTRLQAELEELGSLVPPSDKARAVTSGCLARIVGPVAALVGFVAATGLGVLVAEHAHWALGFFVGVGGVVGSLVGGLYLVNGVMAASLRRAIRRAKETPLLGAISSGSSAAIPSGGGRPDEP